MKRLPGNAHPMYPAGFLKPIANYLMLSPLTMDKIHGRFGANQLKELGRHIRTYIPEQCTFYILIKDLQGFQMMIFGRYSETSSVEIPPQCNPIRKPWSSSLKRMDVLDKTQMKKYPHDPTQHLT